ncbi:MAG: YbjN domain-containing protein [Zoogloea sp.]|nr:YbjN domain-containing protein [Zoogloea sp.]
MSKILQEPEVTLNQLADHLEYSGWDVELQASRLVLHTSTGLGFSIRLDTERQFIYFLTQLPVSKDFLTGLDLVNTLNSDVFLGCFSLDSDNDLIVTYQMTYERGLILAQFSRIVRRFSGMLDHVVENFDQDDQVFAFTPKESEEAETATTVQ